MKRFYQLFLGGIRQAAYYYYPLVWSIVGLGRLAVIGRRHSRIEIGSGPRRRAGFVTVDCSVRCDVPWDLRLGLPFATSSAQLIYAEHVIEHFEYSDLAKLLTECMRVLRPGGELKISVPNAQLYVQAYVARDDDFSPRFCQHKPAIHYHSYMDYLNYIFYMNGEHRTMFDQENLQQMLLAAGASSVILRDFDAELDRDVRRHESLLITAIR